MANLSLKHVYKIYDDGTKAVSDFNLDISDNEFVVFVGPSGCGKSTTLRMIAGLEDITAGDFFIDGVLANNLEPKDRDMAMVFQNYALYPHMSVFDNMAFGLKIRHVPKAEIEKRVNQAAKILDIADQLNKKPKDMSGGQKQRVALGRSIVRKPKVFLLDEPLSNLDAKLRASMRSEITRLHKILGTTFIYVTHDQVEAMTMGTKIVVMKKGVIQQVNSPMELYDHPENLFVAGFIGTPQMNFIDASFDYDKDDNILINFFGNTISSTKEELVKLDMSHVYRREEVVLGIRPEHFLVSKTKGGENSFEMRIDQIEALGNEMNLEGCIANSEKKLVVRCFRDDSFKVGDSIFLSVASKNIHLFEKESEKTLLPRIPFESVVHVSVKDGKLLAFNGEAALPKVITDKLEEGNADLLLYKDSIKPGKDFTADIFLKEPINGKWLLTLKQGNNYFFYLSDSYVDGDKFEFSLDFKATSFVQKEEVVVEKFKEVSNVEGKLVPVKKLMPLHDKKNRSKKKKVFDYNVEGYSISVPTEIVEKVYSLLGKQFELHAIEFSLDAEKVAFADEGIPGVITSVLDYGDSSYYEVKVGGREVYVRRNDGDFEIGKAVHLSVRAEDMGVYDTNFGVKLI